MTTSPTTHKPTEEHNKAAIRRLFAEFVNQGDFSVVDELYRPDIIDHAGLPGAPEGADGVKYTIAGLREAFPDLHVTIEDISAHNDIVVIHNTWRGTHHGHLLGMPPTGRTFESVGIVIWRFDHNGKIAERWEHGVSSNMFAALGMRILAPRKTRRPTENTHTITRTIPLNPGMTTAWHQLTTELQGPRRREYEASRHRLGITHEVLRLTTTPHPNPNQDNNTNTNQTHNQTHDQVYAIIHFETQNPEHTRKHWTQSQHPFDHWLRQQILHIHPHDPWATPTTPTETTGLTWTTPPHHTPNH